MKIAQLQFICHKVGARSSTAKKKHNKDKDNDSNNRAAVHTYLYQSEELIEFLSRSILLVFQ